MQTFLADVRETEISDPLIADAMWSALEALTATMDWMLEYDGDDPRAVVAGATPFLRALGLVAGGWLMARSASVAATSKDDDEFYKIKIATARFYAANLLPQVAAYAQAARTGAAEIMAVPAEAF